MITNEMLDIAGGAEALAQSIRRVANLPAVKSFYWRMEEWTEYD